MASYYQVKFCLPWTLLSDDDASSLTSGTD